MVPPAWTARSVDTDGTTAFAGGTGATTAAMTCATHTANSAANPRGAGCNGDASYVGTEVNLGITWRFAPGLAFDLVGAILFAGERARQLRGPQRRADEAGRRRTSTRSLSRVRYSF